MEDQPHITIKKVALVTGGSRGIGQAIALTLAQTGYSVAISGRDRQELEKTVKEIEARDGQAIFIEADLCDPASPAHLVSRVIEIWGQLDVVVNNAGIAQAQDFDQVSADDWEQIFAVNARAPFFICQKALPYLKLSAKGIIINIASVVGFKGYARQSVYAASKHALSGFTKVLAKEVQPMGIRVHLISPGGVATEMVTNVRPDINTDELIQPEEIAELIRFLVTYEGRGTIDHLYVRRFSGLPFD